MRLINADSVRQCASEGMVRHWSEEIGDYCYISEQVFPVRKLDLLATQVSTPERTGIWKLRTFERSMGTIRGAECSECGHECLGRPESFRETYKYCTNCGAKMDVEDNA